MKRRAREIPWPEIEQAMADVIRQAGRAPTPAQTEYLMATAARLFGRKGGLVKSAAKTAAARANAKLRRKKRPAKSVDGRP